MKKCFMIASKSGILDSIDDKANRQFDVLRLSDIEGLIRFGQSAENFKEE